MNTKIHKIIYSEITAQAPDHNKVKSKDELSHERSKIEVIPQDCLGYLQSCPNDKSVLLMDMANGEVAGGFAYKGTSPLMGQEEKICLNSNLKTFLSSCSYPLSPNDELYICNGVQFAKKECDVAITVAPKHKINLVCNGKINYDKMSLYEIEQIRKQIRMFLFAAEKYDIVIASALGCGAFCNDPFVVSKLFQLELKNFNVKHIVFCIYRENFSLDNYSVFEQTLLNNYDYPQLKWYKDFSPKKITQPYG